MIPTPLWLFSLLPPLLSIAAETRSSNLSQPTCTGLQVMRRSELENPYAPEEDRHASARPAIPPLLPQPSPASKHRRRANRPPRQPTESVTPPGRFAVMEVAGGHLPRCFERANTCSSSSSCDDLLLLLAHPVH